MRQKLKFTSLLLVFSSVFISFFPSLTSAQNIYKNLQWPFYDPDSGLSSSPDFFCLGGPGGSGPLYGPTFPKVSDTAALSAAIKDYISKTVPSSPMGAFSDTYVGLGLKYDVNPVMILAITQKETSLATAGYGKPPKYNIGNIRGGNDSTGFQSYSGYSDGLEAIYKNLRTGLYLDPPSSFTTIAQIMNRYAPPSDNNDTPGYIIFIGDVMKKIFGSLSGLPADSGSGCSSGGSPIVGEDDSKTPCDPRTIDLGPQQGYSEGNPIEIRICALPNFSSTSEESTPGSKYYIQGANGRALVNAAVSGAFFNLVNAAKSAGALPRGAASSFRTMAHQQDLFAANPNPKFVARPGFSNHQLGVAIDFYINNLVNTSDQCIYVSGRCTAQGFSDWEWLNSNAAKYNIKPYVNEFWHWSTTGN